MIEAISSQPGRRESLPKERAQRPSDRVSGGTSTKASAQRGAATPDGGLDRGGVSLYIQVAGLLRSQLESGIWRIGDQLPIIDVLMARYGVSRVTIHQAIARLEADGLVRREQGRGTFVTRDATLQRWLVLPTEWNALVEHIAALDATTVVLESGTGMPRIEPLDGIAARSYWHSRRINLAADAPYSLIDVFLDESIYRRDPSAYDGRPVLPSLARHLRRSMGRASQGLEVNSADLDTAHHLRIAVGTPTVQVRRVVSNSSKRVVYVADVRYPASALRIATVLHT